MLILKETNSYMEKYKYDGPIYNYFDEFIKDVEITTIAPSKEKAISQIKYRLRKECNCFVKLDLKYLKLINILYKNDDVSDSLKDHSKDTCEICGGYLNTIGECPKCDLGED